jgi:PhoH-like ATPase
MEFIPIQLIRGASWRNSFVLADEVQVLNYMEMLTLGTRLGEGSKLVILGDLGQRDENIAQDKTGLWKIANSPIAQESKLVASVHLVKSERSQLSALVSDIFEAK